MTTRDPWHFRRTGLAGQVLATLAGGPAQPLTLFAPRRAGKTEQDLAPYAENWQLLPAVRPEAEAEIDLASLKGEPPNNLLLYLDDLLGRVSSTGKPTILLLDEVQELARTRGNTPLVAALRTSLDKRRDGLRAIFTGSSRAGLAAMFANREAPFFHFATPIDLPALGEPFVDHVLTVFERTAKRALDRERMVDAFDRLHRDPYFFRLLVQLMLYDIGHTVRSAMTALDERIAAEFGYPETWLGLTPIQRETARALVTRGSRPFSRVFRSALGKALDEDMPTAARVQAALRRLERMGVADRIGGDWELADPGFRMWIAGAVGGNRSGTE